MADEMDLLAVTGYPLGAVSPFGLLIPTRILIDHSVLAEQEVSIGSGQRYLTVILRTADLLRALRSVETGAFTRGAEQDDAG